MAAIAFVLAATGVAAQAGADAVPSATQIREALNFGRALRPMIAEFFVSQDRFPTSAQEIGDPSPPRAVRLLITEGGAVQMDLAGNPQGGGRIFIVPNLERDRIRFQCVSPDIAALPSFDALCVYLPGFAPPTQPPVLQRIAQVAPAPTLTANQIIVHTQAGAARTIDPVDYFRSLPWDATGDFPRLFAQLNAEDQGRVIALAISGNVGKLKDFGDVLLLARWLASAGPAAVARLDAQLNKGAADASAAALIAICTIEKDARGGSADCFRRRRQIAAPATSALVEAATAAIDKPPPRYARCDPAFLELLGAIGSPSKPAVPALLERMNESRPGARPAEPCTKRTIAATLLDIFGPGPIAPGDQPTVEAAIAALFEQAIFATDARTATATASSTRSPGQKLLDDIPWSPGLQRRLDALSERQVRDCDGLGWAAGYAIAELGPRGFRVVNQFLNLPPPELVSECVKQETLTAALTTLLGRYPEEAQRQYARARSPLARDSYIAAALSLQQVEAGSPSALDTRARGAIDEFLRTTGYVAPVVRDGAPIFPADSRLHWEPLAEATLGQGMGSAADQALRDSVVELRARLKCSIDLPEPLPVRRTRGGKTLAAFYCTDDRAGLIVAIGTPDSFKVVRFPARLSLVETPESIAAAGTVRSGERIALLILTSVNDSGDSSMDVMYDLVEEDGDWFTVLRSK